MSEFKSLIIEERQRAFRRKLVWLSVTPIFLLVLCVLVLFVFAKNLRISTEDDYAANVSISYSHGSGIKLGNKVFSFSADSALAISAPGYVSHDLMLADFSGVRNIDVLLMLAAREVEVSADKDLTNPEWYIDGEYVSSKQRLMLKHKPGSLALKLTDNYIEPASQVIEVAREGENKFVVVVKEAYRDVTINSEPTGATVSIDGTEVGVTPYSGSYSSGEHELELSIKGYSSITYLFELTSKLESFEQSFNFNEEHVTVPISVSPKGGSLRVNGQLQNRTDVVTLSQLRPSQITYSLSGYQTAKREINARSANLTIKLKPIYGQLDIKTTPQSQVLVDGEAKGETPLVLTLSAKDHEIELRADGHRSERKLISVKEGKTSSVNVRLRNIKSENLQKAKAQYTNSLGMTMKRFLPSSFIMGAPRSEIGQQAHEVQRQVDFTRHIYVASAEVSNAQFAKFNKTVKTNNEPVSNVSWFDAALFCNWLSRKEGLRPFYVERGGRIVSIDAQSTGYRLPTEAEWEWLAKAAGKSSATIFSWGDTYKIPDDSGNVADTSAEGKVAVFIDSYTDNFVAKAPVASFKGNTAGLFDLFGNVSEWVHDAYGRTPAKRNQTYKDYMGPDRISTEHVVKGANYQSESWTELRNSFRLSLGTSNDLVGFRVARYIY